MLVLCVLPTHFSRQEFALSMKKLHMLPASSVRPPPGKIKVHCRRKSGFYHTVLRAFISLSLLSHVSSIALWCKAVAAMILSAGSP